MPNILKKTQFCTSYFFFFSLPINCNHIHENAVVLFVIFQTNKVLFHTVIAVVQVYRKQWRFPFQAQYKKIKHSRTENLKLGWLLGSTDLCE